MDTLMKAAKAGGLDEKEVKEYLESGEDKMTIKNQIRRTNGEIDGVPHIVVCGTGSCSSQLTCREETRFYHRRCSRRGKVHQDIHPSRQGIQLISKQPEKCMYKMR